MAPEPEPAEYVKICDAYGSGFFYIPGTDTCLSITGYVWYQIAATGARNSDDTPGYYGGTADGWVKGSRTRVNFDARSETEWGTLRGFIRLQADWNATHQSPSGDGNDRVDQAYIQLGGLMMGYSESFFVDSKNGGASNYGSHSWGGMYYGYQERQLIGYRFGGKQGFFGAVSLEDESSLDNGHGGYDYMPDVVGKIGFTGGWGTAWLVAAYDDNRGGIGGDDSGFAVQAGVQINMPNSPGSSLRVLGYYNDSDNAYGPNSQLGYDPEWSVLASYNQQFSPTFGVSVAAQYFDNLYAGHGSDDHSDLNAWGAEISSVWMPVTNFEVRPEVHYDKVDGYDGTISGFLRFTRYF
jgi:hypothetical protein